MACECHFETRLSDSGSPLVLADPSATASRVLLDITESLAGKPRGLAGMSLGLSPAKRA